ncbi:PREDICTED: UDP-xylose and UDP-N-acetylglucosamine transporter-like [Nicrophorus vespilloides]|uniref:UDP-xylose and UDP-N-acetylglucosamine transporter-like n=1 Tax=Nicrophorus vespilloides TaxID=110193 RepID=A0ABM1MTG3_NICVS|nr:PREDICTED: UDP-xylose and UDP-N-acetylglucosamine transporter-like [Nicrophorus vespilloides]XP_017777863.1 PREDICTED: UDP-xylose and UDP-N-acetylglucosamine transporter-like [Nicrophorus vespilloides]
MNSKAVFAILMVYIGCGLNNVFLEYLVRSDPGCGHLITFLQFLFIAIHGFIMTSKFGTVQPKIGMTAYFKLVVFFFITSVFNNWAFSFNIPVPLHMIFRAGSLIANMIMGIIILKKKYAASKFISVAMITAGIIICTFISSNTPTVCNNCDETAKIQSTEDSNDFFWWIVGIVILTLALLLSARMGIFQESLYKEHGKHPSEALYYTHLLSLPLFVFYAPSIYEHFGVMIGSEPYQVPMLGITIPLLVVYMVGNVLTQYLCISSVYVLTTECTSLTVTLVVTLRKFLSLIFSIVYFNNPFTVGHWFGTALVFVGTLIFTEVFQKASQSIAKKQKTN